MNYASLKIFEPKINEKLVNDMLGDHPAKDFPWEISNALTVAIRVVRDRRPNTNVMLVSLKFCIPLTRVHQNSCGYSTFALLPKVGQIMYLILDQVLEIAHNRAKVGGREELFMLEDKPQVLYPTTMEEVRFKQYLFCEIS